MNYIVVAYYTKKTLYESMSKILVKSLERFKIPYYIEGIDSLGDWFKNTGYKPIFIKTMLKKFPDKNIVYVDCDAEFLEYPKLFEDLDCNIAVHLLNRTSFRKYCKGTEILSGTIFLKNNDEVYNLVEKWEQECLKNPTVWDQKSLENILGDSFYNLPVEYCKIFDMNEKVKNPVIVHYQASRLVRRNRGKLN